jgi:hypothetical protein
MVIDWGDPDNCAIFLHPSSKFVLGFLEFFGMPSESR